MALETSVLVVGGGPVGLTLAIDLARRGIDCILVERRETTTEHPKATLLGARSMELYRRWGLDAAIYEKALPPEHNYFIIFATRLAKQELYRFTSPSIDQVRNRDPEAAKRFRELAWSPYGKTQIGQQNLEPVLVDEALRQAPKLDFMTPAVDATYQEFDPAARQQLLFDLHRLTNEVLPALWLVEQVDVTGLRPEVEGLVYVNRSVDYDDVTIAE